MYAQPTKEEQADQHISHCRHNLITRKHSQERYPPQVLQKRTSHLPVPKPIFQKRVSHIPYAGKDDRARKENLETV